MDIRYFFRPRSVLTVFLAASLCAACGRNGLVAVDSQQYRDFVSAFNVGLAGLQTGEDIRARERLTKATQLVPGEPAAWANLALLSARQQELDPAFQYAEKASTLAPQNSRIEQLMGSIEDRRGKLTESLAHLKKAAELDPGNIKAIYALAEQTERQGTPQSDSDTQVVLEKILSRQPDNAAVQVYILRLAVKQNDAATVRKTIVQLKKASGSWSSDATERLAEIERIAASGNLRAASVQAVFLRNLLVRVPSYRRSLEAVKTPAVFIGDPFVQFLRLPNPESQVAAPDTAVAFTAREMSLNVNGAATWAGAAVLDTSGKPTMIAASAETVTIAGGATLPTPGQKAIGRNGLLAVDLDYDFKMDVVLANAAGVQLYRQESLSRFQDVSAKTKLPSAILQGGYTGAWPFDVELDGDLDIVLGATSGNPAVLRNNGDLTFAVVHPFRGVDGLLSLASGDIDGDGDPDVALIDGQRKLHVFLNERLGEYRDVKVPSGMAGDYVAVAAGKLSADNSLLQFVGLASNGAVDRVIVRDDSEVLSSVRMLQPHGSELSATDANLLIADFDNNGSSDVMAGKGRLFLNDGKALSAVKNLPQSSLLSSVADLNNDGRLDIVSVSPAGKVVQLFNHGEKNYKWQNILLQAANGHGDQRINSFGIGGEVEIRAGLLAQKQSIQSPLVHFGIGNQAQTDVARIVWPNGSVQAEFELKIDDQILAQQRLKGSCPSLFAWNGQGMKFVKDSAPWSPALGLHINAQTVAQVGQTEEWFKIPGEAIKAKNNHYDLRVTDELWETFYIDYYALQVVDHPEGTEIYTDERCAFPAPPLKIFTVSTPRPFASAIDDRNQDVHAVAEKEDKQYLDTFGRGRYQGVTRDHWVELELPADAPRHEKLVLIASGWLKPTDTTINVALGQNSDPKPESLSIEARNSRNKWIKIRQNLGFPAGKLKNIVIPMGDIRKFRLRTNMEIYWDQLAWAVEQPASKITTRSAPLMKAELRYRGFSKMGRANGSSPEIPEYEHLEGTAQKWRDLEGYYTRFGDVRQLLAKTDDRYIIQNAGDELQLQFAALPPPEKGWKRDFVMIGDGWVKDGDYNTVHSKTVLPLPYHGMNDQDAADWKHREDWSLFHTRYVAPDSFSRGLFR